MTKFQARLFHFIRAHIMDHGYSPSFREIKAHLGCGTDQIYHALTKLSQAKRIKWHRGFARGIELGDRAFIRGEPGIVSQKNDNPHRHPLLRNPSFDGRGGQGNPAVAQEPGVE